MKKEERPADCRRLCGGRKPAAMLSRPSCVRRNLPGFLLVLLILGALSASTVALDYPFRDEAAPWALFSDYSSPHDVPQFGSIAFDSTGNAYLSDTRGNRVLKLDSSGQLVRAWGWGVKDGTETYQLCSSSCRDGIPGSGTGQLNSPRGIALHHGTSGIVVYVVDQKNKRIARYNESGAPLSPWGTDAGLQSPEGAAVDSIGRLYVSDTMGNQVVRFKTNGDKDLTIDLGPWNPPGVTPVGDIAVDSADRLYVADHDDAVIRRYKKNGKPDIVIAPSLGLSLPDDGFRMLLSPSDTIVTFSSPARPPAETLERLHHAFTAAYSPYGSHLLTLNTSGEVTGAWPVRFDPTFSRLLGFSPEGQLFRTSEEPYADPSFPPSTSSLWRLSIVRSAPAVELLVRNLGDTGLVDGSLGDDVGGLFECSSCEGALHEDCRSTFADGDAVTVAFHPFPKPPCASSNAVEWEGDCQSSGTNKATITLHSDAECTALSYKHTYTVNSTSDTIANEKTNCENGDSDCTLRGAIQAANATACADRVVFDLPIDQAMTTKPFTYWSIELKDELPDIVRPLLIDGATQAGYKTGGPPVIEIRGSAAIARGLRFYGPLNDFGSKACPTETGNRSWNSLVKALAIGGFGVPSTDSLAGSALVFRGGGGHVVEDCYIGTDITGSAARPSNVGISIAGAVNTLIQRNVISGNRVAGIRLHFTTPDAEPNVIRGNIIGPDSTGSGVIEWTETIGGQSVSFKGNGLYGIYNEGLPATVVGGFAAGDRNVISGNGGVGLWLSTVSALHDGVKVLGNYIGVNETGTTPLPNTRHGIVVQGSLAVIGSTHPGGRNVISGNGGDGIRLESKNARGGLILGNHIGVGPNGTTAIPNGGNGVYAYTSTEDKRPRDFAIDGNVISANNASGIAIEGEGFLITRNAIGTDACGDLNLGNGGDGVKLSMDTAANWNTLGSLRQPELANVVAHNGGYGINRDCSNCRNVSFGNIAFENGLGGTFLDATLTQRSPAVEIENASITSGVLRVKYNVTLAPPLDPASIPAIFWVEFYRVDESAPPGSTAQGATYIGVDSTHVVGGTCVVSFGLAADLGVDVGDELTATATEGWWDDQVCEIKAGSKVKCWSYFKDADCIEGWRYTDTSGFSEPVTVQGP